MKRVRISVVSCGFVLGFIEKGSITIDGISLTVAGLGNDYFEVSIIPHTGSETILLKKNVGDIVNLENDILGKYVKKLLGVENSKKESKVTMEFLAENGFV